MRKSRQGALNKTSGNKSTGGVGSCRKVVGAVGGLANPLQVPNDLDQRFNIKRGVADGEVAVSRRYNQRRLVRDRIVCLDGMCLSSAFPIRVHSRQRRRRTFLGGNGAPRFLRCRSYGGIGKCVERWNYNDDVECSDQLTLASQLLGAGSFGWLGRRFGGFLLVRGTMRQALFTT